MRRVPFVLVILVVLPLAAIAGDPTVAPTTCLSVEAMAAPRPALKYVLLPEVREMNPGNAAQWYLRCFAEQRNFFFGKEATAERVRFLAMPLADLAKVKDQEGYGGNALRQADWASRLDTIDWQVLQRVQSDGLELTQPELGSLKILGTALKVRFRLEVARRDYDDATRTARTMLAFARHLGESPTEGSNRLGLTVAEMALDVLEEMLQQPGCPNLYWALTDLPCPLVDLRKGLQGQGTLVATDLKPLLDNTAMTDEQLEKAIGRLSGVVGFAREQAGEAPRSIRASLTARTKDADHVRAARARLIEAGCAEALVPGFPATQVILLDEKRDYEIQRDERMKLLAPAPWEIDGLRGTEPAPAAPGLFADLLPQVLKSRRMQARLEQRIALLRHVEALRLFAATNGGKLPEKLSDVTVPLPVDPFTGKPFGYAVEGKTARLRGGSPRGEEKNPAYYVHVEITIGK